MYNTANVLYIASFFSSTLVSDFCLSLSLGRNSFSYLALLSEKLPLYIV